MAEEKRFIVTYKQGGFVDPGVPASLLDPIGAGLPIIIRDPQRAKQLPLQIAAETLPGNPADDG